MFSVEWLGHKVALKASNGKYICTKKNGQLLAVSDSISKSIFVLMLLPFLPNFHEPTSDLSCVPSDAIFMILLSSFVR